MPNNWPKKILLPVAILLCLLFCGCAKKVALSGTTVMDNAQGVTAVVTPEDLELLDGLESLVSADTPDHRRLFAESGYVWDKPTRIRRVKAEVDKRSKHSGFGNIRSVDVANELKMSVSLVEDVFQILVQTSDYYFEDAAVDSTGKECLTIVKRK